MEFVRVRRAILAWDLAPLIDVVFLLLIFFMLSASFARPAVQLDLPQAASTDRPAEHRIIITATADGQLRFNGMPIDLPELSGRLIEVLAQDAEAPVAFEGDRRIPYELFIGVMDAARTVGIRHLDLSVLPARHEGSR